MKRCRYSKCRQPFEPKYRTTEECCSTEHAILWVRESAPERREKAAKRIATAEKRERKAEIKSRKDWLRDAQSVFNAMIRERDHFKPCVSCGDTQGPFDAGHYLSVGAYPELRFEPLNAHKQCRFKCNRGGGYITNEKLRKQVTEAFRLALIDRIGLQQVEWLESYHEPLHPKVDWLREQIRVWRLETRRMRESRDRRAA
ncbi:MAG: recombination protein NinG [Rhodanobacter sp.]